MTPFCLLEKSANAKWRAAQHLASLGQRMFRGFSDELAGGTNLAALKQRVGGALRAPGTSPISQRVQALEKAQLQAERAALAGDDDLLMAWNNNRRLTTHDKFLNRWGQAQPYRDGFAGETIGDKLYRGTVGGSPWGGGTFEGAFHYASPFKSTASTYTGIPAPFMSGSPTLGNSSKLSVIHQFKAPVGQRYGSAWAPEDILTASRQRRGDFYLSPRTQGTPFSHGVSETAIMPQHNPYTGTELMFGGSTQYGRPWFFPAGKPAQAAQSYVNQVNQSIRSGPGGIQRFGAQAPVNTTQWQSGLKNQRLQQMHQTNPSSFKTLMQRRAERFLSPAL